MSIPVSSALLSIRAELRIQAEMLLGDASKKLLGEHRLLGTAPATVGYVGTVLVVRKELDKLIEILKDDHSDKHGNVAARLVSCTDYLALIPNDVVLDAREDLIAAHKVLKDVHDTILY